jgi:hypothetical protein
LTNTGGQSYSSFEADLDASGALKGSSYAYTGITGQAYDHYQVDLDASGALVGSRYFMTPVAGAPFARAEIDIDSAGRKVAEIDRLADGALYRSDAIVYGPTGSSETITGYSGSQAFVFHATFGKATIFDQRQWRQPDAAEHDRGRAAGTVLAIQLRLEHRRTLAIVVPIRSWSADLEPAAKLTINFPVWSQSPRHPPIGVDVMSSTRGGNNA